MNGRARTLHRRVSGVLGPLMLVLSVAVPLLERDQLRHETAVEREHDPATCPTAHDHTVCTQVGANHSAAGGSEAFRSGRAEVRLAEPTTTPEAVAPAYRLGPPPRAPPSV